MPEQPDTSYTIGAGRHIYTIEPYAAGSYKEGAWIYGLTIVKKVRVFIHPDALAKLAVALQSAAEMADD